MQRVSRSKSFRDSPRQAGDVPLWPAVLVLGMFVLSSCTYTTRDAEPVAAGGEPLVEPAIASDPPPVHAPPDVLASPTQPEAVAQPVEQPAPPPRVPVRTRVSAVGDIMLDGKARPYFQRHGYDHAFKRVSPRFAASELVIGNLEGPLTDATGPLVPKKYLFRSPARPVAAALAGAGIGAVSLANNHALDYGMAGLRDTLSALRDAGILFFGAGESLSEARTPAIFDTGSIKIGMLGYSNTFPEEFWADGSRGGTAFGHEAQIRTDVASLAQQADIVTVSFHWGREGTTELRPYQRLLAHAAIDAGADLVIGHHPHVLQEVEAYGGGVILYSLGNFTFGSFSTRAKVGAIAHVEFLDGEFSRLLLEPLNVNNFEVYFQPRPLDPSGTRATFDHLRALSLASGTRLEWRDGEIVHLAARPGLDRLDQ